MPRLLKVLCFALAVVAFGAFAASCGSHNAQYRVVNAIPNTTSFDANGFAVYMNGAAVFSDVCFTCVEPSGKYQSVSGGSDTLDVYTQSEAGQTGATPEINSGLNLGGGTQYTIVMVGNGNTVPLAAQVITDTNPIPTSGDADVRIIDASLILPAVDVWVLPSSINTCCAQNPPGQVASGLQYPTSVGGGYQNVGIPTSGGLTAWVTVHGNDGALILKSISYTLNAGQNYTLVLTDAVGGGSPPQFVFATP
ncbi:MAG: DUF4397 domain-containing protein [Terriglobales bacterium]